MRRCPVCQSTYADDSLRFCLQDGATLEGVVSTDEFKTWVLPEGATGSPELPPTVPYKPETAGQRSPASPTARHSPRDTSPVTDDAFAGQPQRRSTASIVALTIVATVALLALGGLAAWLLMSDNKEVAQRNENVPDGNATRPNDNQNVTTPNGNTRTALNTNTTPTQTPNATPTPIDTPTVNPSAEEGAVRSALNGWLNSFRARDLDSYMARYASVLEAYYRSRNVSVERVRADKARAFDKYTNIEVWLSDVRVEVDASGQRAFATFTKSWRFTGPEVNPYTGSGPNRFTFRKIGGNWYIIGEEDL